VEPDEFAMRTEARRRSKGENEGERARARWLGLDNGRAVHLLERSTRLLPTKTTTTHFAQETRLETGPNCKVGVRADGVRAVSLQDPHGTRGPWRLKYVNPEDKAAITQ
jgi:hypothetical protein